jgi:hypothetical protein
MNWKRRIKKKKESQKKTKEEKKDSETSPIQSYNDYATAEYQFT